jgi:hypothetical protein
MLLKAKSINQITNRIFIYISVLNYTKLMKLGAKTQKMLPFGPYEFII